MSARFALRGAMRCSQLSSTRSISLRASYTPKSLGTLTSARLLSHRNIPVAYKYIQSSAILRLANIDGKKDNLTSKIVPKSTIEEPSKVTSAYEPEKLSEDILTIPNVLTIMRLASTPVLGYLVVIDEMSYALGLLALSGFTDYLDGWLARRYKSATVFGSIADPAADKALMTVMVGALAWRGMIPMPLVLLIIGRDVALVISAFLIRYRSLPEPKTFSRYWDPRLPSAKVEPTLISKYNTFLQIVLVAGCTLIASFNENWRQWWNTKDGLWNDKREDVSMLPALGFSVQKDWGDLAKKAWHGFMVVVSFTTIWSGSSYLFSSRGVQYLSQKAKKAGEQVLKKQVK